jgi:hypothetical protein
MSEELGKLLFINTLTDQQVFKLLSNKVAKNTGGLGEAFEQGYLSTALTVDKGKQTVVIANSDKLLEFAELYRTGGQLEPTPASPKKPLILSNNAYQAALCYALVLHEASRQLADTQQSFDMDFHKLQKIQAACLNLLETTELVEEKFKHVPMIVLLRSKLESTSLQTEQVLSANDICEGSNNEHINNSVHTSRQARLRSDGKSVIYKEKVGRRITGFEMAGNELFRLIVGNHLPATYKIKHEADEEDSIASAELKNYKSLDESKEVRNYLVKTKFKGLAKILIAGLYLQENDLHEGNCGTCIDEQGRRHIVKIDGDQLFYGEFTARLHGFNLYDPKVIRIAKSGKQVIQGANRCDGFGIHHYILETLPNIPIDLPAIPDASDAATKLKPLNYETRYLPFNSICYGLAKADSFNKALQKIALDKEFIAEKHQAILKITLLPRSLLNSIINAALDNPKHRMDLAKLLIARRDELIEEALLMSTFKNYLEQQGFGACQQIRQEIHAFLNLPENLGYLPRNDSVVSCYDEAITERFRHILAKASLSYQVLEDAYLAQPQEQTRQERHPSRFYGLMSHWCCLFTNAEDEEQPLLMDSSTPTPGTS